MIKLPGYIKAVNIPEAENLSILRIIIDNIEEYFLDSLIEDSNDLQGHLNESDWLAIKRNIGFYVGDWRVVEIPIILTLYNQKEFSILLDRERGIGVKTYSIKEVNNIFKEKVFYTFG